VLLAAGVVVWGAPSAVADCVSDPDALGFREMIRDETTGEERFPVLLLGIVVANRDFGGDPDGGRTIARVRIVEHPVGSAPGIARVRFWKTPPGVGVSANLELEVGGRYALVARRLDDGSFRSDGACGESRRLNRERFRELVRYARLH
jgi:hypothetical protein